MPYDNSVIGWMTPSDLKVLEELALQVPKNGIIVEVGSLYGRSAVCFAMTANPSVQIHCIDIFHDFDGTNTHEHSAEHAKEMGYPQHKSVFNSFKEFRNNTSKYSNIRMIRGESPHRFQEDYIPPVDIDLFFLDAEHKNPSDWNNLCYWAPRIKAGGILAGHDYGKHAPAIVENCAKLESILNTKVILTSGSSMWYVKLEKKIESLE